MLASTENADMNLLFQLLALLARFVSLEASCRLCPSSYREEFSDEHGCAWDLPREADLARPCKTFNHSSHQSCFLTTIVKQSVWQPVALFLGKAKKCQKVLVLMREMC